jgi:predicted MPP superfamily phosphohydrolase
MARLARIAPTYAIEGNWDANRWRTLGLFEGTGVKELDGEAVDLTVHGAKLRLGGAPPWRPWWVRYLFREAPDRFNILLYHFPEVITAASQEKVDLVMVGHTHGGQVAAPFYGPVVTFSPAVRRYPHGLFRVGGTCLCVNRGIGTEALPAPPLRFLARPEVTILDIVPE